MSTLHRFAQGKGNLNPDEQSWQADFRRGSVNGAGRGDTDHENDAEGTQLTAPAVLEWWRPLGYGRVRDSGRNVDN
jgi:hypothetical protein